MYLGAHPNVVLLFPQVSTIISTLETILTKGDVQSMVVEYEALNVIIRYVHCNFVKTDAWVFR